MVTWLMETFGLSMAEARYVLTVVILAVLVVVWVIIVRTVTRRVDDTSVAYHSRKVTSYTLVTIGFLALLLLWGGALQELATFFGLAAAGIAIGLSDLLKNIAGWFYILLRRPFRVDDRVEIDGVAGDVIDIRVFRTTLLEIGNWVEADQSTGRLVHVPNGKVLSTHVFNATEGFGYLWHEIPVRVTFESDWKRAEQLMLEALETYGGHTAEEAAARIEQASRSYKIRYTHLTPTVYVAVEDRGVRLTGRVLVDTRRRRAVDQQVWRSLLDSFEAEPSVQIAYPTSRTYLRDPLRVEADGAAGPVDGRVGDEHPAPEG